MIQTLVAERRQWLYLALLAAAVFLLIPHFIGFSRAIRILYSADPFFLILALVSETLRYLTSAASTRVLAHLFRRVIPFEPMIEAFFAGAALNRSFSTGGAPGMLLRLLYLTKQQISAGQVAAIFVIEDIVGLVVGGLIVFVGALTLATTSLTTGSLIALVVGFPAVSLLLVLLARYVYNRKSWVERCVHDLACTLNRVTVWLFNRSVYDRSAVQHGIDQFYAGMSTARQAPLPVIAATGCNVLRSLAGMATVYFCFLALGYSLAPGALILIYTSASLISTVSAVPGELAILGGSWAILTLSFGIPREIAMMALIISRTITFWLPIPVGYLALWNLRRQSYI